MQKPIKIIANWKSILTIFIILLCFQTSSYAKSVTLQWDANSEPDFAGYKIYYDTDSGALYSGTGAVEGNSPIDVGNVTEYTLTGLADDEVYFFVVTAYDNETPPLESTYSNEVNTLSITSPEGGFYVNATNYTAYTVAGTAAASASDIIVKFDVVEIGGPFTADGSGNWSGNCDFSSASEGQASLTVESGGATSAGVTGTLDITAPGVTITTAASNPTNSSPFSVTITFSEAVTGFVVGDITVGNGAAGNFAGSGTTYTADITPSADGAVTVDVGAGAAADATGNSNAAATTLSRTYDGTAPAAPAISTDGGAGPGDDYSTTSSSITLEGTCAADTVAVYVNGSTNGVTYTSNATSWTYSGTLQSGANDFEITAEDAAGNLSSVDSITVTYSSSGNNPPNQPTLSSPAAGATDVSLTPTLQADAFSDSDSGDTHAATRWQISTTDFTDTADYVLNIKSSANLISLTAPEFVLNKNTQYYWRAAFYDNNDAASDWSDSRSFTTINQNLFTDDNSNGIPDDQEVADTVDLDGDGTSDVDEILADPDNYKSVNSANGSGQIGVSTADDASATIESIKAVNSDDITDTSGKPDDMVLGLVSLKLNIVTAGDTASVTIYLSEAAPADAKWYKYNPTDGWLDYSAHATFSSDRKSVVLVFKDGGYGDADGVENAVIIDPSGFGTPSASSSANASGGGCFIATAAFGSPLDKHVDILRHLRDDVLLLNKCGQGFVKAYYRYSPPVADFIRDHDTVRLMVRWSLLPVVGLSWMTLQVGAVPTLLLIFMVLSAGWLFLIKKVQGVGHKA